MLIPDANTNDSAGFEIACEQAPGCISIARKEGITSTNGTTGQTVNDYVNEWFKHKERRGKCTPHTIKLDRGRYDKHVSPRIGSKPMAAVTRADLEQLVAVLDDDAARGRLSWNSGVKIWGIVRGAFDEAVRSKLPELRILTVNPASEVRGPDRGARKSKVYLYPSEVAKLLECDAIDVRWRRLIAVAIYLGPRESELAGLPWDAIDFEHGAVHIRQKLLRDTTEIVPYGKSDRSNRRFAIEPELLPLLRAMRDTRPDDVLVFPELPDHGQMAKWFRGELARAGVDRPELFMSNTAQKQARWHDVRASTATWQAVRGDSQLGIMGRMGHEDVKTTLEYVREAEQVRANFGTVFGPIPACLFEGLVSPRPAGIVGAPSIRMDAGMDVAAKHGGAKQSVKSRKHSRSEDGGIGRRAGLRKRAARNSSKAIDETANESVAPSVQSEAIASIPTPERPFERPFASIPNGLSTDPLETARRVLADQAHALMIAGEFDAARAILDTAAALTAAAPNASVIDFSTRRRER